ncbi:MAG: hypothetical protein EBS01_11120 [Verrucomicrobia bacterium]|nr:hypothetical protein [Verrucomicrobiota bacterium]
MIQAALGIWRLFGRDWYEAGAPTADLERPVTDLEAGMGVIHPRLDWCESRQGGTSRRLGAGGWFEIFSKPQMLYTLLGG